ADGNLDTLLVLQNYFSALYPDLDTQTEGTITLYDKDGGVLGKQPFSVAHCGGAKFRVSHLLEGLPSASGITYGTLQVHIAIPRKVLEHIKGELTSFYFWDRFYLGYTNRQGQTCFVHGVDKTHIFVDDKADPIDWYRKPRAHQWAPEIPVDIEDYRKFSVILINRTARASEVTLTLSDDHDHCQLWRDSIPAKGVRRFELTAADTQDLLPRELRMRVQGMTTQYGRPVVFKEFANGAISAMHC
ncbi:MAG: hypothetical protein ACE5Q6_01960, partial [Dehalococcoidia bacterium]